MTRRTGNGTALALVAGMLMLAACGAPEEPRETAPVPGVAPGPAAVAVSIMHMQFNPDTIRVQKGDTIVWTNNDLVDHDVTQYPDSTWSSGPLHTGESWKWVADGPADYFCSIHVVMRGKVIVE